MSDDEMKKAIRDAMHHGTGFMMDGEHIPYEEVIATSPAGPPTENAEKLAVQADEMGYPLFGAAIRELAAERDALHARAEAAEAVIAAQSGIAEAKHKDTLKICDRILKTAQIFEAKLERARDALTLIERLYYIEGKDAAWRASRMNSVAREAQSEDPDLARFHRIFPRAALDEIKGDG